MNRRLRSFHGGPFLALTAVLAVWGEAPAADRYPLGPGMRWIYLRTTAEAGPEEVTVEVKESLGEGVFRVGATGDDEGNLVQVEGNSVYSVTRGPAGSLRTLVLDFEKHDGDTWTLPCDGEVLVESTSERVETRAGVFEDCYRVRTWIQCLPGLGPSTAWFARGVGRVKLEFDGPEGLVKEELIAFQPLAAFIRGDSNTDRKLDLSDAVFTLRWLFLGEATPACAESADADRDGEASITDAVYVLQHLFLSGPPPAEPFPACGRTDLYSLPCEAGC